MPSWFTGAMNGWLGLSLVAASLSIAALRPSVAASPPPVSITVHAELGGSKLHIRGHASVPDGAWIIYAAYRRAQPRLRVAGYARVRRHSFGADVDVADWPAGKISVDANFQMRLPARRQPEAVVALYGAHGQRLTGPDVVRGGGSFRAAVASAEVTK
jgi:hypothetical protein